MKMHDVKVNDEIRNTISEQRTKVADMVQQVRKMKWKRARHLAEFKKKNNNNKKQKQ